MNEAGGWRRLVLIPTGNVSLHHHLVGTFTYCSVGEKNALLVWSLMAEEATVGGERPLVVPLLSVFDARAGLRLRRGPRTLGSGVQLLASCICSTNTPPLPSKHKPGPGTPIKE